MLETKLYRIYLVEWHEGDTVPSNPREIVEFEGTEDDAQTAFFQGIGTLHDGERDQSSRAVL